MAKRKRPKADSLAELAAQGTGTAGRAPGGKGKQPDSQKAETVERPEGEAAGGPDDTETVKMTVRYPKSVGKLLKIRAIQQDKLLQDILLEAALLWLDLHPSE